MMPVGLQPNLRSHQCYRTSFNSQLYGKVGPKQFNDSLSTVVGPDLGVFSSTATTFWKVFFLLLDILSCFKTRILHTIYKKLMCQFSTGRIRRRRSDKNTVLFKMQKRTEANRY